MPGAVAQTGDGRPFKEVHDGAACRLCSAPLSLVFVDLGSAPPCESYLRPDQLDEPEPTFPQDVRICASCLLVQLPDYVRPEAIFRDYAYFSSYSDSWVEHARRFADNRVEQFGLDKSTLVVEVASNDGYLLQHLVARGVTVLGIEPAANVAEVARAKGVATETTFFSEAVGRDVAARHGRARLVVANNVLAHVPDPVDLVRGMQQVVADDGVVSVEFPHLLRLIEERQFDTIYHEHYSYLSLHTASAVLLRAGLRVIDVEELLTHGGSLRVTASSAPDAPVSRRVNQRLETERKAGLDTLKGHEGFADAVREVSDGLIGFLKDCAMEGRSVAGYGAPGKGNTMLNHCGITAELLPYTVDRSPHKQGKFLPGSHIPVLPPSRIDEHRPDYIVILPWNLRKEISEQLAHTRAWGARFVVAVPRLTVF